MKERDEGLDVLVVDDDKMQVLILRTMLEEDGFSVRTAGNGEEAFNAVLLHAPDVVIADIMMPVMDGFEFCRRVKEDARFKQIPVILISTLSGPQDIVDVITCGADNFIVKPFDKEFILEKVDVVLHREKREAAEGREYEVTAKVDGKTYSMVSDCQRIMDVLMTSYECIIHKGEQLQKTNKKLYKAIETIRTLRGLVPICSHCKRVRDDDGYWRQVEEYIGEHSEAEVKSGLCPACMRELYPELYAKKE